ncbi:uncharacterized protein LOC131251608 isoform X2 [Magnolia sinica]|uniref:uncharacterized protein LOC131251608 isoform X2 n=1 Tax=Magnolia sinica TaxID=86752 RepID=UPI00265A04E2|nr:uncharacterized protein LOC131251608 isoform X2 [Magnolia sinica]
MAEDDNKPNGVSMDSEENPRLIAIEQMENNYNHREETLYGVFNHLFAAVFFPDPSASSLPLIQRLRNAFSEKSPSLKEATRNSTRKLLVWTRRGSPLRALLVISVGTITLLALTGLMVFMLFFQAATVNAIVISLLMSLAAAGGFLAIFFACLTGIYIMALSVAVFVISTTTISTIIAVIIATGWIGFFSSLWLAANKGLDLTKHSLAMTRSAIFAYSTSRHARRHGLPNEAK